MTDEILQTEQPKAEVEQQKTEPAPANPLYLELKKRKEEIEAKTKPMREERDKLVEQEAPLRARIRELSKQIEKEEQPLVELIPALAPLERQEEKRNRLEAERKKAEEAALDESEPEKETGPDTATVTT